MRKIFLFLMLLFLTFVNQVNAWNFGYPFNQVAVPKCRFSDWSSLSEDCKMSLPRIISADYTKYKEDKNMRIIYSILWWSTYDYGWDVWYWSHLWVDIATSAGTPVISIGDWEVITAGWLNGRWNTVVIKHKLPEWKYIYSNYSHLNKVLAQKWEIKKWQVIWEVWATGNAYGNHLHFQIDITNQSHPYWYTNCSKGVDIFELVNNWMCRDYLIANTIDPILFLESNWSFTDIQSIQQKQTETKKIESKNIKSREQIFEEEINEFLKFNKISYSIWNSWNNFEINKKYTSKLSVINIFWKNFDWTFPGKWLELEFDRNSVKVFPESIIALDSWNRDIFITWLKSTRTTINFKLWKKIIFSKTINIYKSWELINPTDASIILSTKTPSLWDEKLGWVIFKTKFSSNQINIPYNWTYILKAINWKVKFCNVSKKKIKICNPLEFANILEFRYEDTLNWVLLFNMIVTDYAPIKLTLSKIGNKYDIAWTKYNILVKNPIWLNNDYLYYNENMDALKKMLIRLNNSYLLQDRTLTVRQAKEIITNYWSYNYLKSWNDLDNKKILSKKIIDFEKSAKLLDNYKVLTRGDFTKMVFDTFNIPLWWEVNWRFVDEKWDFLLYIQSLRSKYNFRWKDQFAERYFQPDKNITIWEALYFFEKTVVSNNF